MILANVLVQLKASVLDPQGEAISKSLVAMGYDEVQETRVGKQILLKLDTNDRQFAEERVRRMCDTLLANTVIEKYSFELTEVAE